MGTSFRRRDFLRITVVSAIAVAMPNLGCNNDDDSTGPFDFEDPAESLRVFPQGIASGDPRPDSVLLWTRVEPDPSTTGSVKVTYEVATDVRFKTIVAQGEVTTDADADYTVRLKVTNLSPYSYYYYRFTSSGIHSGVGRTKTAPTSDQDVEVKFAFAACQDFVGRYYHAWQSLCDDHKTIDFVLFLGDYIYETDGDPSFQTPTEERKIVLPDGLELGPNSKAAKTLADYRSLYKQYRSDANLRRAHQIFPFITIWDDHEFANDCWQDHSTHFAEARGTEKVPEQRADADRAWFEYQAADVEYHAGAGFPNDIRIYRSLRYGKHVELFLTDQRYYRDDHVIPEGPADLAHQHLANSAIGSRIFCEVNNFNAKEAAKKPTMLGVEQKQWLIDSVKNSTATWKIWGSETQLAQMKADLTKLPVDPFVKHEFYLSTDQWDGYRTERAEILQALSGVQNLCVVTGDIHAFYASELHVDFDDKSSTPVAVEYVTAGISSVAIAPGAAKELAGPLYEALGLLQLIPRFDELLQESSPHYKYANSTGNGIALCKVTSEETKVTLVIVSDVTNPTPDPTAFVRKHLRTAAGTNRIEILSDQDEGVV